MRVRLAWLLGLLALVVLAFPVQAKGLQEGEDVYGYTSVSADISVEYQGSRRAALTGWGVQGPYQGDDLVLAASDRPASNYREKKQSRVLGSVRVTGSAENFVLAIGSRTGQLAFPGEKVVAYIEYSDGSTEVKTSTFDRSSPENEAAFSCSRSGAVYTFAAETLIDVNEGTPHFSDVQWLITNRISTGFPDDTFRAFDKVARVDMAAFLRRQARIMGVESAVIWTPTDDDWAAFSDISRDTPHAEDVLWLASTGISTGFPDGTFRPYDKVARCDMAAFLYRLYSLKTTGSISDAQPGGGENTFTDINGETPHVQEVLWLASTGISKGFPNGAFKPYEKVARCDMAAFLHRLYDIAE